MSEARFKVRIERPLVGEAVVIVDCPKSTDAIVFYESESSKADEVCEVLNSATSTLAARVEELEGLLAKAAKALRPVYNAIDAIGDCDNISIHDHEALILAQTLQEIDAALAGKGGEQVSRHAYPRPMPAEWRFKENFPYLKRHGCNGCHKPFEKKQRVCVLTTETNWMRGDDRTEFLCETCAESRGHVHPKAEKRRREGGQNDGT